MRQRHLRFIQSYFRALWGHHVELTVTFALVAIVIVLSAGASWIFEAEAGTFDSFGEALYWATTTITTVGYGDMVPVSSGGRFVAGLVSILGAGFLVVTAGILAVSFMEHMRPSAQACPHCGNDLRK